MDVVDIPLYLRTGKQNMAANAFRELRLKAHLSADEARTGQTANAEAASPTGETQEPPAEKQAAALGFDDLLDAINPLQHLPIVSTFYREITGDKMGSIARIAGGLLYGGPVGMAMSVGDTVLAEASGKDLGGHIMTALFGDDEPGLTQVAAGEQPPLPPEETTASIAMSPTGPTGPTGPRPASDMPSLSPEAFNLLLQNFGQPAATSQSPENLAAAKPAQDNIAALMRQSLDKYQALQTAP